jgi:isocitrate dehydrogenase
MFEAIHGSAPRRAGQNMANPSGLLQGAVMMLNHIGETEAAEKIQNAWLKTIEDGIHTYDIFKDGISKSKVGTSEFADAIIANLGQKPSLFKEASYSNNKALNLPKYERKTPKTKELIGVDIFVHWNGTEPVDLSEIMKQIETSNSSLSMITNRGIKVWPEGFQETFCTDHWRCRFKSKDGKGIGKGDIIELMNNALSKNIDVIKTENLYTFDGKEAFSAAQGQ